MNLLKKIIQAIVAFTTLIGGNVNEGKMQISQTNGSNLEWAFTRSGEHPETLLINTINSAVSTLDIAIYSLSYPQIVEAIKEAKKRGVEVRIITDKHQSGGKSQAASLKLLNYEGIPIKINNHSGLMHLKVTIADHKIATTGSFNYSKDASTINDEVLMVLLNSEVAESFTGVFELMWNDTKRFKLLDDGIAQV